VAEHARLGRRVHQEQVQEAGLTSGKQLRCSWRWGAAWVERTWSLQQHPGLGSGDGKRHPHGPIPHRFTIAAVPALASVRAVGLMPPPRNPRSKLFCEAHWEPYLAACRSICSLSGSNLREVDQTPWAANGVLR